jgi:hypothetical protein
MNGQGWYFNPFAWQFLFTIGALLAVNMAKHRGSLPNFFAGRYFTAGFLAFAYLQSFPWHDWNLPDVRLFVMVPPDKSTLAPLRILDILALIYLLFSSPGFHRLVHRAWFRPVEACGRHSLEVFSVGCLLALFGRLEFHTAGHTVLQEVMVNLLGFGTMAFVGLWLDRDHRPARGRHYPPAATATHPCCRCRDDVPMIDYPSMSTGSPGSPKAVPAEASGRPRVDDTSYHGSEAAGGSACDQLPGRR